MVEKMPGQQEHIAAALPQRGQVQGDDVETVVEVFTKAPGRYFGFQIAVGGRHNAHVHFFAARAAHPLDFLFLQHPQNLYLQAQIHLAYFVQKNRAAVAHFKPAGPGTNGVGKGPLLMAEKLAFQQILGNGPAVDGHKGLFRPLAVGVQGADQQLLASSGFSGYKHGAVRRGHLAQHFEDLGQGGALPDNAAGVHIHE